MNPPSGQRPTWAEIDLEALTFNFRSVKAFVGEGVDYMAVVKANAYGHGAVECSRRLESEGADWFGVATVEEGIELRDARISRPILILGGFWPGQEELLLDNSLTPVVFRLDQAESLAAVATSQGKTVKIHVKIDTGMNRVGFRCDEIAGVADKLASIQNLEVEGLMTHFAVADKLSESDFTNQQMARFSDAVEVFHAKGFRPKYLDMANSPGAVVHPLSRAKMVRLGGLLYGLGGDVIPREVEQPDLKPVMSLRSKIALIKNVPVGETIGYGRTFVTNRDTLIATIPIGYHDGYSRSLSNKGRVIINGEFAPVVGRTSMDWIMVDVTDLLEARVVDTVTLIGSDGERSIKAEEIAELTDTISYEVTCGISGRVPRIYR